MTITPTDPATPAIPAAAGTGTPGDPASAADFLAAILQALAPAGTTPATTPQGADQATGPDKDPATDVAAVGLVVPPGLAGQLAAAVGAGPVSTAAGRANVADGTEDSDTRPTSDNGMSGDAVAALSQPTTSVDARRVPANTGRHDTARKDLAASVTPVTDEPATSGGPATTPAGPATPAAGTATESVGPPAPVTAPTLATGVPAGMTLVSTSAPENVAPAQHVTRQVFPEVTSLATRGDGTHRITLTLKPEALGEVRVVMTVRDGAVHVRLAAGHEAQQALREGSPELTRLLGAAGASESRITVRDLPATAEAPTDASPDLGTGGDRPQDQHAGTRAHDPAMDGTHDGTRHRRGATGATPPRSNEPVTHTRAAGVDVTM
jgi:flagellar hook-length control protein FliK